MSEVRGLLLAALAALACLMALAAAARAQGPAPRAHAVRLAAEGARTAPVPPPARLDDLPAWLDYRARNHLDALPLEARLFYRRGLLAHQTGARDEAVRLVRGAADLDPAFVAPHLTLASWMLLREPSQALLQYASVMERAREDFPFQLAFVANGLYFAVESLLLGFLAAALLVIALRNREFRHAAAERLLKLTGPASARAWAWALLVLPFAAGFGLVLPALLVLALLWPVLRAGERTVFVGLLVLTLAAPWAAGSLDRLAIPLRDGPPFHGLPRMAASVGETAGAAEAERLARENPQDPLVQFAAAWSERREGNLARAEAGYRRALALSPLDDRALDNLGNVLAMQGRAEEALALYLRASAANPANAAAAFNASQIYTQRYDYHAATEALSRASALNFELVKGAQAQSTEDGVLPLVDEWIAPRSFWSALSARAGEASGRGALPPAWRSRIEFSGWGAGAAALLLTVLGLALGARAHRAVPLRTCGNCETVVCRRCSCRRREVALCPECAAAEARAETPDFGRVLLAGRRRLARQRARLIRTAFAALVPGFGLLAHRRIAGALSLLVAGAGLGVLTFGAATPFASEPRLADSGAALPLPVLLGLWIALYVVSLLGYFSNTLRADAEEAAQAAPVRGRIRLSSHESNALAA